VPDVHVSATSDGNISTESTPLAPLDSDGSDGTIVQKVDEKQDASNEQLSPAPTVTSTESPAVSASDDATPAHVAAASGDTERPDQSESSPPPAPAKSKFGFIARRTAKK
jgi:hypothetical protein